MVAKCAKWLLAELWPFGLPKSSRSIHWKWLIAFPSSYRPKRMTCNLAHLGGGSLLLTVGIWMKHNKTIWNSFLDVKRCEEDQYIPVLSFQLCHCTVNVRTVRVSAAVIWFFNMLRGLCNSWFLQDLTSLQDSLISLRGAYCCSNFVTDRSSL